MQQNSSLSRGEKKKEREREDGARGKRREKINTVVCVCVCGRGRRDRSLYIQHTAASKTALARLPVSNVLPLRIPQRRNATQSTWTSVLCNWHASEFLSLIAADGEERKREKTYPGNMLDRRLHRPTRSKRPPLPPPPIRPSDFQRIAGSHRRRPSLVQFVCPSSRAGGFQKKKRKKQNTKPPPKTQNTLTRTHSLPTARTRTHVEDDKTQSVHHHLWRRPESSAAVRGGGARASSGWRSGLSLR